MEENSEATLAASDKRNAELVDKLSKAKTAEANLIAEVNVQVQTIKLMESRLKEYQEMVGNAERDVEAMDRFIKEGEAREADLTQKIESLKLADGDIRKTLDSINREAAESREIASRTIAQLRNRETDLTGQLNRMADELKSARENAVSDAKIEALSRERDGFHDDAARLNDEVERLNVANNARSSWVIAFKEGVETVESSAAIAGMVAFADSASSPRQRCCNIPERKEVKLP